MTVKISISLPDDVAERLSREENVSAFITEAVRAKLDLERGYELLKQAGYQLTPEDVAEVQEQMKAAEAQMTPEIAAKGRALLEAYREVYRHPRPA